MTTFGGSVLGLLFAKRTVCFALCCGVVVRLHVYRGGDDLGGDALQQAVAKNRAVDGRVQIYCPPLPVHRHVVTYRHTRDTREETMSTQAGPATRISK